jgi:hypothetical protein
VKPGSQAAAVAAERSLKRQADAYWGAECEPAREAHRCTCCGEECPDGVDCCCDDFPEAGDVRETGR